MQRKSRKSRKVCPKSRYFKVKVLNLKKIIKKKTLPNFSKHKQIRRLCLAVRIKMEAEAPGPKDRVQLWQPLSLSCPSSLHCAAAHQSQESDKPALTDTSWCAG